MPKRLGKFELPKRLAKVEDTATDTYAMFVAEPFETGYGHTIGNTLRRVLLSSIEGAAISSIRIDGVKHEFQSIDGVVEDVTDIVLNLKQVLIKSTKRDPIRLAISVDKEGAVTAADIQPDSNITIVNPKQLICTLDRKRRFQAEIEIKVGRGYCPADENKVDDQPIGVIAVDSLFSPVRLVKYSVEQTRVGQMTDYDKLILEITTDGRITPDEALKESAAITKHHLDVFRRRLLRPDRVRHRGQGSLRGAEPPPQAAQHERQRNRTLRPRRQLPQQRQHHHRRRTGDEDRAGNAQIPQLRQEIPQRNQAEARATRPVPRHEVRRAHARKSPPKPSNRPL